MSFAVREGRGSLIDISNLMSAVQLASPNLTQHPPRSARVKLGGYVVLPRMIDKCRATLAGLNGEYHYNCPLDQGFLAFVGIDAEAFKAEVAKGLGDGDLLSWIQVNSATKPAAWAIAGWSAQQAERGPFDTDSRAFFNEQHAKYAPSREDVGSWFDLLDLDDYVSYGGKA